MIRIFILALSTLALSGCFYGGGHRDHGHDHHDNDRGHYNCPPGGCGHNPGGQGDWHH